MVENQVPDVPNLILREREDIVDWLVDHPFASLSDEIKMLIISKPKPRPEVLVLNSAPAALRRGFNVAWYDRVEWLTGSVKRQKLFCWPCLLFGQCSYCVWSKIGFDNLKNMPRCLERHTKKKEHIYSFCKFKLFGKVNTSIQLNTTEQEVITLHNNQVRENRECLKRLIDLVIFFAQHDNNVTGMSNENFKELLSLFRKYDSKFNSFIAGNDVFSNTIEAVRNDLLESIYNVLNGKIEDEIHEADFFSWQIDETANNSQISIILRYIKNGQIVERFLGFHDVSPGQTADRMFSFLLNLFEKYCFENKLVAQCYDGAVVLPSELDELQNKISSVAPQALFTHCQTHDFNLILCKTCIYIKEIKLFLSRLSGFSSFFSNSFQITDALNSVCGSKLAMQLIICWNYISHAISVLHTNSELLINFFTVIIQSEDFRNDLDLVRAAAELKGYLQDSYFCFLLSTFKLVFDETETLNSVLQNNISDTIFCDNQLNLLISKLEGFRDQEKYVKDIINDSFNYYHKNTTKKFKLCIDEDVRQNCQQLFVEIVNTVIGQFKIRFSNLCKFRFLGLLDIHSHSAGFPEGLLQQIPTLYSFFDVTALRSELMVVYANPLMFKQSESESSDGMLSFMYKNGLDTCTPQLYKLLCLALTIPFGVVPLEQRPSTPERVQAYCREHTRLSKFAVLTIEKDLISSLVQTDRFYDDVTERFAQMKNRNIPLLYKRQ